MWVKTALIAMVLTLSAWAQDDKQKEEEAKTKIAEFKKELKTCKTDKDVARAIENLGALQHSKIIAELKTYLTKSAEVAAVAAEQLGKYKKDKEAAEALMNAAGARRDKEGVTKCLRYAGDTEFRPITGKVLNFFRNKDTDVAREAVDTCGKLKSKDAIDPLLGLLKELEGIKDDPTGGGGGGLGGVGGIGGVGGVQNSMQDEQLKRKRDLTPAAERALENITGKSFKTVREWNDWWRKEKGAFKELE